MPELQLVFDLIIEIGIRSRIRFSSKVVNMIKTNFLNL